ncbi:hypothetical protein FKW77_000036 [Venturia effusa]|uniref:Uncharacterized protein n=1 Tax=Venturia effusa TaxID=50376 RepID=A0A517L4Q6_9PEZI|nr:hypothetical protein FKW77_000036 [Venturia effusa]
MAGIQHLDRRKDMLLMARDVAPILVAYDVLWMRQDFKANPELKYLWRQSKFLFMQT